MGIALAVPISAYAQESDSMVYESTVADVVADEGGLASVPVDASGIEIDSEGKDALANGAPFDVTDFSRAQKEAIVPSTACIEGIHIFRATLEATYAS